MLYTINKDDIIAIALLYKYLQDGTIVINEFDVNNYMEEIEKCFCYIYYRSENHIIFTHLDPVNVELLKKKGINTTGYGCLDLYTIADLDLLIQNYLGYPEELTNVSLYDSNLKTIGIEKEDLKLTTVSQRLKGRTRINRSSEKSAIEWTKSYLESCGCTDIKLSPFFEEGHAFGGFNTRYEANKKFEKVNVKAYYNKENK